MRCGACWLQHRRPRRTSRRGRTRSDHTTARASTRASSRCAELAGSRRAATGSSTIPLQQADARPRSRRRPRSTQLRCRSGSTGAAFPPSGSPLERCAHAFGRLGELEGGPRVITAMRAHPEMLRGPVAADAMVIRELDGWVAKGGAEGLFCACSPRRSRRRTEGRGRGVPRHSPCTCRTFSASSASTAGTLGIVSVENSHGEPVGESRTRPKSHVPKR